MSKSKDLTEGPIWRLLLTLAAPMVVGIVASISVSLVDTYFVGKLGTKPLAALSFTFPVAMTVISVAIGLGAGAGSVVSRAVGAKDKEDARRLATDSLILAACLVTVISVLGFFTINPLFSLLGAHGEVLGLIERYMQIWFIGMPFLVIPMVANSILRAIGDTFRPSVLMIISALVNVATTPLLIFGWGPIPTLGIEGAAYGTLIAHVFASVCATWLIIKSEKMLTTDLPPIGQIVDAWRRVASVALPASIGNAVNPIGIAIVTAMMASFGEATVAAFGVATRIESFSVIPMLALSAVIGPVAGQNWGSGKLTRVRQALIRCYQACFIWALILTILFQLFADAIIAWFAPDPVVREQAVLYLMIVPLSVWGYGWVIVTAGAFNAIGKSVLGLAYYLVRTAVFYVPLAWVASIVAGSSAVFIAISVANCLAGIIVSVLALRWFKRVEFDAV